MKKALLHCLLNVVIGASSANAIAASDQAKTTTYKNQRGSTMMLERPADGEKNGKLHGTFTTAVGNCPADVNRPLPLAGFMNGNAVTVTINFPNCQQTVAMAGHFIDGYDKIQLLWLDAKQAKDPLGKNWGCQRDRDR